MTWMWRTHSLHACLDSKTEPLHCLWNSRSFSRVWFDFFISADAFAYLNPGHVCPILEVIKAYVICILITEFSQSHQWMQPQLWRWMWDSDNTESSIAVTCDSVRHHMPANSQPMTKYVELWANFTWSEHVQDYGDNSSSRNISRIPNLAYIGGQKARGQRPSALMLDVRKLKNIMCIFHANNFFPLSPDE